VGNKCGFGRGSGVTESRGDSEKMISWEMVGAQVRVQAPLINVMLFQGEKDERWLLARKRLRSDASSLLCLVNKQRSGWREGGVRAGCERETRKVLSNLSLNGRDAMFFVHLARRGRSLTIP